MNNKILNIGIRLYFAHCFALFMACAKMIRTFIVFLVLWMLFTPAFADPLLAGARIVRVANTRGAGDASFAILTQGGTGPCTGGWVYFYPTGASTPDLQKRAYAAVMLAMASSLRIDVESQTGSTSCLDAYFISVYQ